MSYAYKVFSHIKHLKIVGIVIISIIIPLICIRHLLSKIFKKNICFQRFRVCSVAKTFKHFLSLKK